jgi:hypothetical protein
MISFAESPPPAVLLLKPGRALLPQRWGHGSLDAPQAGLDWTAEGRLVFSAGMKPSRDDLSWRGQSEFAAELWRRNVVECFLSNPDNGHYLEIHLAPNGQWWACLFTAPRLAPAPAGHPLPLSTVEHRQTAGGQWWEAIVSVPAEVVCGLLGARSVLALRGNLTALRYEIPDGRRDYFSLAPLPGDKPDFHQPAGWLELGRAPLV